MENQQRLLPHEQDLINLLLKVKQPVSTAPTYNPKNFFEQIIPYVNGSDAGVYIYMDGGWKFFGTTSTEVIVYGGKQTTVGGSANEIITVTGAENDDYAIVTLVDPGTNNRSILYSVVTSNTLTVAFSADPGNDAVFSYIIMRTLS